MLLLLILAAFALRLYRLDLQDVWWDEARNIEVAARPVTGIATDLPATVTVTVPERLPRILRAALTLTVTVVV